MVLLLCVLFGLCTLILIIVNRFIFNKSKNLFTDRVLNHTPLLVFLDSNNWYQSIVPQKKFNQSMDTYLQQ